MKLSIARCESCSEDDGILCLFGHRVTKHESEQTLYHTVPSEFPDFWYVTVYTVLTSALVGIYITFTCFIVRKSSLTTITSGRHNHPRALHIL
jgi:hypothetical protein